MGKGSVASSPQHLWVPMEGPDPKGAWGEGLQRRVKPVPSANWLKGVTTANCPADEMQKETDAKIETNALAQSNGCIRGGNRVKAGGIRSFSMPGSKI